MMAKQNGIIRLRGTIDAVTFYQNKYGDFAQRRTRLSKERIATDPVFERTRENMSEFGSSARAGKYFRYALRLLSKRSADSELVVRVMQLMTRIKNMDAVNTRGKRNVAAALENAAVRELLRGFEFNARTSLGQVLPEPFSLDVATGGVAFANLEVRNQIVFPVAATHVTLRCGWAKIDFASGAHELVVSDAVKLAKDAAPQPVTLVPLEVPSLTGIPVYVLLIEFSQHVNGEDYVLRDGEFNVLSVVGVG